MKTSSLRGLANTGAAVVSTLWFSVATLATHPVSPSFAYYMVSQVWTRTLFRVWGVHLTVEGRERVDFTQPSIYMSNHQSHVDILVLYASTPTRLRFLAKKELKRVPIFGWAMTMVGHVFIDRSKRKDAFHTIDLAAESVEKGGALVVFPEGTRSPDGSLGPFKKGGFVLAEKAGVPIVPVGIVGTYGVMPRHAWQVHANDVTVRFGDPIPTVGLTREELSERVRDAISALSADAADAAAASGRLPLVLRGDAQGPSSIPVEPEEAGRAPVAPTK